MKTRQAITQLSISSIQIVILFFSELVFSTAPPFYYSWRRHLIQQKIINSIKKKNWLLLIDRNLWSLDNWVLSTHISLLNSYLMFTFFAIDRHMYVLWILIVRVNLRSKSVDPQSSRRINVVTSCYRHITTLVGDVFP